MLRNQLPSSVALFAFEAAARHMSFTKAAVELNVTQPAVSAAIGKLERFLAIKLFGRHGVKLQLTEAGAHLYQAVGTGFQQVEAAISEIKARTGLNEPISLSISSAMTAHWFVPRLPEFQRQFPGVELRFSLTPGEPRGPIDNFDLAVRLDSLIEGDVDAIPFVDERVLAVCSPSYVRQFGLLSEGKDHTLVSLTGQRIPWSEFLRHVKIPCDPPAHSLAFSDYAIVIHAAVSGQGIALGWASVVAGLLASGMMVTACSSVLSTGHRYYLAIPKARADRSITRQVRDWMIQQVNDDLESFEKTTSLNVINL